MNEGSGKPRPLPKDWRVWGVAIAAAVIGFLIGMVFDEKLWHRHAAWGDVPTWLAVAAATAGGWIALSQLRSQREDLRQDAKDRRRAQAARVFIGAARDPGRIVRPYVRNASDFSIYEATLWYLGRDGLLLPAPNDHYYLGTILPDEDPYGNRDFRSTEARSRTVLTFRDANSVRWIRMPGGVLDEQSAATARENVVARLPVVPPDEAVRGDGGIGGAGGGENRTE